MNQEIKEILQKIYTNHTLLDTDLDYKITDKYISELNRLAQLSNSCFFIVDLHKFEYIFTSENFKNITGYLPANTDDNLPYQNLLDSKIHPDDFYQYKKIMLKIGEFLLQQPKEERTCFKHIFELRILNIQKQYIRVSWERRALETDKSGNLWLMLGIVNVLPDQDHVRGIKSSFIHLKTGKRILFNLPPDPQIELSSREKEVLLLIQQGFLSKEIAGKLFISVHTVNVHRQNILQKMNADNSMEAVRLARVYGIIE